MNTLHKVLRYIALVGIFIIPLIPLIVSNSLFFPFITGKNFTFRIIVEIVFAAWAVLAVTNKMYRPRKSWILYSFSALVAIMAIADALGVNPVKSFWSNFERMDGWITLGHLYAYFLVAGTILTKEKYWDALFQTIFGVNIALVVYALMQVAKLLTINQGGVRVDSTLGNTAYLAALMLFGMFFALLYIVRGRKNYSHFSNWFIALGFNTSLIFFVLPMLSTSVLKDVTLSHVYFFAFFAFVITNAVLYVSTLFRLEWITFALIFILDGFILYESATRGAMIGALVGLFITTALIPIAARFKLMHTGLSHEEQKQQTILVKVSYGVLIALAVLVGGFYAVKDTAFVRNNPVLVRFASISATEKTTLSRFKLWQMAIKGFEEHPVLGWGHENFNYVFNKYYNPQLYDQEQWFDRTHDIFFDWLITGGILGFAAYFTLFGSLIYLVWFSKSEAGNFTLGERSILTGLLFGYLISNITVFDNITSYVMYITLVAYIYNRTAMRPVGQSQVVENAFIVPVALIALVVAVYGLNIRPIEANRSLIEAISVQSQVSDLQPYADSFKRALNYSQGNLGTPEIREQLIAMSGELVNNNQPIPGKDDILTMTDQELKKQLAETPDDARYYVLYGSYLARANNLPEAEKQLIIATQKSPHKQSILFVLASVQIFEKKYADAEKTLQDAYESDPADQTAKLDYAASLIYTGKNDQAQSLLSTIDTATVVGNSDVMQALLATKQYQQIITYMKYNVDKNPSPQTYTYLASAYFYAHDKANAVATLKAGAAKFPEFKQNADGLIKQVLTSEPPQQ